MKLEKFASDGLQDKLIKLSVLLYGPPGTGEQTNVAAPPCEKQQHNVHVISCIFYRKNKIGAGSLQSSSLHLVVGDELGFVE